VSAPHQSFATSSAEGSAHVRPTRIHEVELYLRAAPGLDYLPALAAVDDGHQLPAPS
jgi:hypothetical protein